jgi:hypothetical protein
MIWACSLFMLPEPGPFVRSSRAFSKNEIYRLLSDRWWMLEKTVINGQLVRQMDRLIDRQRKWQAINRCVDRLEDQQTGNT